MSSNPSEQLFLEGPRVAAKLSAVDGALVVDVNLLIDTGADQSVLDVDIVESLGSVAIRETEIAGVTSAPLTCPVHRVHLTLLGRTFEVDAVVLPRAGVGDDGLLGRDVLQALRFVYDGHAGTFALEPATEG